jgi:hypothetical protein
MITHMQQLHMFCCIITYVCVGGPKEAFDLLEPILVKAAAQV